jgi:hypothetical protein
MGDNTLPASKRWISSAKDANLWSHLEQHLDTSYWPSNCPHPLCSLQLDNETAFLYHLSDVHGLGATQYVQKRSQQERNSKDFVLYNPNAAGRKRNRQDDELLDQNNPDRIQTISPRMLLKVSPTGDGRRDLPRSTYGELISPLDVDEIRLDQFE